MKHEVIHLGHAITDEESEQLRLLVVPMRSLIAGAQKYLNKAEQSENLKEKESLLTMAALRYGAAHSLRRQLDPLFLKLKEGNEPGVWILHYNEP